jgi:hypothetical protein
MEKIFYHKSFNYFVWTPVGTRVKDIKNAEDVNKAQDVNNVEDVNNAEDDKGTVA